MPKMWKVSDELEKKNGSFVWKMSALLCRFLERLSHTESYINRSTLHVLLKYYFILEIWIICIFNGLTTLSTLTNLTALTALTILTILTTLTTLTALTTLTTLRL